MEDGEPYWNDEGCEAKCGSKQDIPSPDCYINSDELCFEVIESYDHCAYTQAGVEGENNHQPKGDEQKNEGKDEPNPPFRRL
jgi:hypothetical protein